MTDSATWRSPAVKITVAIIRIIWVFLNNVYAIPAYMFYMFLLRPLMHFNSILYWGIEGLLFQWMTKMVAFWMWTSGYTVAEVGDNIRDITDDGAIVMCNHQSTGDVPTLFYVFQFLGSVMDQSLWVMDIMFKYTNFGFISQFRGDFFIQQGKETRHLQGQLLREHLLKYYWSRNRRWIIVFPEGGFLRKRRATSKEFGRKNGFPILEHVTLPRIGAMQTIMEALGPAACQQNGTDSTGVVKKPLKWIVDMTIGYPSARPMDMQTVIAGQRPPQQSVVYYRKYPVSEVPMDSAGLTKWMYDRFEEKEHLLEEFYATGHFPEPQKSGSSSSKTMSETFLAIDTQKVLMLHAFFLLISAIPLYYFYSAYTWVATLL